MVQTDSIDLATYEICLYENIANFCKIIAAIMFKDLLDHEKLDMQKRKN